MPYFEIDPPETLVDQRLTIKLHGLKTGATVTIRADLNNEWANHWASWAEFVVDETGLVDLQVARPRRGAYTEPDPMGLFWSMQPQTQEDHLPRALWLKPMTFTLRANLDEKPVAEAVITRKYVADGVQRFDIRDKGLVATLFVPPGEPSPTAAIVWGGSGGDFKWSHQVAALLAASGHTALAVAYFDWEGRAGLPDKFVELPLAYLNQAIDYFQAILPATTSRLVALGFSKGGELALFVATLNPAITGVIAYAPSSIIWPGFTHDHVEQSSWSYEGRPVPYLSFGGDYFDETIWQDEVAVARATIPVERINGPILLVSGTADETWPASAMAERVLARLRQYQHPYTSHHLCLAGADHALYVPYTITTTARNAQAQAEAWQVVGRFMRGDHGGLGSAPNAGAV